MILVTGATGCLGANLVEQLSGDFPIRVLVRDEAKLRAMVGDVPCEVVRGDLTDLRAVERAVAGVSTILHCAVMNHGAPGFTPEASLRANRSGMRNVLQAAVRSGLPQVVFTPLQSSEYYQFDFNLADIAEVWRRGSVIASWLLDLTAAALASDPKFERFSSRGEAEFQDRLLSAMRFEFGGHVEKASES